MDSTHLTLDESLFIRFHLEPEQRYNWQAYQLPGSLGITYDPRHKDPLHVGLRALQRLARVFNWRLRDIDPYLMHGWSVLRPHGNPVDNQWVIGHHTWVGGITSVRSINDHRDNDDGAVIWIPQHDGVRLWIQRAIDLVCAPQMPREDDARPDGWQRSKFALSTGLAIPWHTPQYRKPPQRHLRRIACAVTDVWQGRQFLTSSGKKPRRFTCIGLTVLALQSSLVINLLSEEEKARLRPDLTRLEMIAEITRIISDKQTRAGDFVHHNAIGLQNAKHGWPAVLGRALDAHAQHGNLQSIEEADELHSID